MNSPVPVGLIAPVHRIWKGRLVTGARLVPPDTAPAMVKMQVGEEYISDVVPVETVFGEGSVKRMVSPEVVIAKEFLRLFIPHTIVDKNKTVSVFDKQTTGRHVDQVIGIGRIGTAP